MPGPGWENTEIIPYHIAEIMMCDITFSAHIGRKTALIDCDSHKVCLGR